MNLLDQQDFEFLMATSKAGKAQNLPSFLFLHLNQPIGLYNYIRIANDIARQIPAGRLLDWGAGYGQMTYLLQGRGLQVIPFDIGDPNLKSLDLPLTNAIPPVIRTQHPTTIPFAPASFDAVLSCGVLEHVDEFSQPGNEIKSLVEIARLLRPGGKLFIYQLPQRDAWQEATLRRFNLGYSHPRRYTAAEIVQLLEQTGYRVLSIRRANLIPKNLTGMPRRLRQIYSRFSTLLISLDQILSQLPLLRNYAGVLEITAEYPARKSG